MPIVKEVFKPHKVQDIKFESHFMALNVDGILIRVDLEKVSHLLSTASEAARNDYEISPGGYGIHWRQIDEDLSISGLLRMNEKQYP